VFDTNSRVILRTLRGHNTVVKAAMFVPHQPTSVITASHDKTVRVWDLPTESTTFTYDGHGDYVQCVDVFKQHSHLMVTGSYDHTLRLFDTRASTEPVHAIHLDHPIDACVAFPGSNLVAVANGPQVDMVDFASTSASRVQLANHQKSVLTLAMDTEAGYLLTGGLDQMVKVYNTSTWKVVHSVPCDAAAFAVALSPDDTRLAIGMAGGLVSIRRRRNVEPTAAQQAKRLAADPIGILTGQRLVRLSEAKALERAPNDDATVYTVPRNKSKRLGDYDKLLKSFQYAKALDAVLARHSPAVVVAVVHELHYRGGLRQAIARRTEDTLAPILKFILSNIHQPKYTSILIQVAEMVLDTYRHVAITSTATTASLVKLQRILWQEIKQQNQLSELKGMVEMVMTMNALAL
jgi:U3 small nucleolar RNA-associated protein 15